MTASTAVWRRLWRRLGTTTAPAAPEPVAPPSPRRRNLLVFHLESVSWQTVHAFPEAFPQLSALMAEARTYRRYFSSASSTMMVLAALLHANDFEMDAAPNIAAPSANNPSLFPLLQDSGYATDALCVTLFPERPILSLFEGSLPPVWKTNDFAAALERFDRQTSTGPFATYVWSQIPHIEANMALAPYAEGLDDLVAGGCAVADTFLGAVLDILRGKGILDDTTVVVFGDHGDDYYTHGFKSGFLHAVEPYTPLVHTPLVIRDVALPVGQDGGLVSTVDIGPACLELLGLPHDMGFARSGRSFLGVDRRDMVFAQNLTARQPDWTDWDIRKAFAAIDGSHILMATSRGLEMYNHRLDPANQGNILHHCELDADGRVALQPLPGSVHPHFHTIRHMWRTGSLQEGFLRLRTALRTHVDAKNAYARGWRHTGGTAGPLRLRAHQPRRAGGLFQHR